MWLFTFASLLALSRIEVGLGMPHHIQPGHQNPPDGASTKPSDSSVEPRSDYTHDWLDNFSTFLTNTTFGRNTVKWGHFSASELNETNAGDSKGVARRDIPFETWGCFKAQLSAYEIEQIAVQTARWSDRGHRVKPRTIHEEFYGGAGLYLCNCKLFYADPAPEQEMREFVSIIADPVRCGPGKSGWLYSRHWQKSWAVADRLYVANNTNTDLCPPFCVTQDVPCGHECKGGP
ncbi:hypothetical protein AAE478_005007 [Parahypoxylon ruwenzoriense]